MRHETCDGIWQLVDKQSPQRLKKKKEKNTHTQENKKEHNKKTVQYKLIDLVREQNRWDKTLSTTTGAQKFRTTCFYGEHQSVLLHVVCAQF